MSDSEAIGNFPSLAELRERTVSERGKRTVSERGKRTIAEPRGGVSHPATEPDEFGRKSALGKAVRERNRTVRKLMRLSAPRAEKALKITHGGIDGERGAESVSFPRAKRGWIDGAKRRMRDAAKRGDAHADGAGSGIPRGLGGGGGAEGEDHRRDQLVRGVALRRERVGQPLFGERPELFEFADGYKKERCPFARGGVRTPPRARKATWRLDRLADLAIKSTSRQIGKSKGRHSTVARPAAERPGVRGAATPGWRRASTASRPR